jgi:RND family efflux transporter MFP subunit
MWRTPHTPHAEVPTLSLSKGGPRSTHASAPSAFWNLLRGNADHVGIAPQDEGGRVRFPGVSTAAAILILLAASPASAAEIVAHAETVVETKAVFGQVETRNIVPARARIGGTIQSISVTEGSEVTEGQVIAVVVDEKLALQREAAEAEVKALQSQLDNAATELDRAQRLLASGSAPQSRVDTARTQVEVFTNQLAAAESNRAVIEQQSREGEVLAPASGRVLSVPVTPGSVILAGEEIARVAGGGTFLRLSLPERHAAEIVEGGTVTVGERVISADTNGGAVTTRVGKLAKVYPEITAGRVQADVEVEGLGDYFVGERTLVWIPVAKRAAIMLPAKAVTTRHGVDTVRVMTDAGEIEVAVILGDTHGGEGEDRVEVLTGIHEGDRVVVP